MNQKLAKKNVFLHIPLFFGKDSLGFEIYVIDLSSFQNMFRSIIKMEEPNTTMSYFFNICPSWYVKLFEVI
jgi:hypothetical protein